MLQILTSIIFEGLNKLQIKGKVVINPTIWFINFAILEVALQNITQSTDLFHELLIKLTVNLFCFAGPCLV